MNLWIRSQDKESLLKIENISIDNENWVLGNLISDDNKCICDYWKLGHYETKERALEVLDEIQNKINLICIGNNFGSPMIDLKNPVYIYEMPKE